MIPDFSTHQSAKRNLRRALQKTRSNALKAPPVIDLPTWADEYRFLALSAGATGGPWKTSRVEIARGPMKSVTEPGVKTITAMTCTQLLKTSLLENIIGYFAHLDPSPILLTQPKDESAKAFSKERLTPMVRATPVLRDLIGDVKTAKRNSDDTVLLKTFPGGLLAMASAGSPANLAMRAIRVTLLDEIDKYETTKEGDPVTLAEERTATFSTNRLNVRACSPTWEETSRIFKSYGDSDQRRPFVACPRCEHEQTLDFFRHVHWSKNEAGEHDVSTAAIHCESCQYSWSEPERMAKLTTAHAIRWYQTRKFTCCGIAQDPMKERNWDWDAQNEVGYACCKNCLERAVPNRHAGFQASKLYSPFITVVELAEKWKLAKDDPETKQTFYNTQLGLPFSAQATKEVAANVLVSRAEQYDFEVPLGACVITAGVDVQSGGSANEGRLEVETVAWGIGEESWSLEHKVFTGDPSKPELWKELDEYLLKGWKHALGHTLHVSAACIDSGGHNTQDVYRYARERRGRNIWAVKGASDRGGQWSPVWPPREKESKKYRTGFRPIIVGVNAAKESIRQRLLNEVVGPGYCHFPVGRPPAYYDQLTAERLVIEKKAGVSVRRWHLPKTRANEALDCRVYAYAALWGLYHVRRMTLERQMELLLSYVPPKAEDPAEPSAQTPPSRVRRSSFVTGG